MTVHGGDVWDLAVPASRILDFSANINPRGLPERAMRQLTRDAGNRKLLSFYPDPSARRLREALSRKLGVAPEAIVVGPGAESLLSPIMRCLQPARVMIPVPAFSEYQRVCDVLPFPLERNELFRLPIDRFCAEIEREQPNVILLNNPHNPTGGLIDNEDIRRVAQLAPLIVDEAFIDYVRGASLAGEDNLIVIRSLTKFYGCPALRVGYAVAHPPMARRIAERLPTWAVTQFAMDALAEAITDEDYERTSVCENAIEREWMTASLRQLDLFVFPSAANYLFIELAEDMPSSAALRANLITRHSILIRNCDSYSNLAPGRYIRVAVRTREDNTRLIAALEKELVKP
jgi:threonine-phosphate decarboxylase